jgi:hypothetical protein
VRVSATDGLGHVAALPGDCPAGRSAPGLPDVSHTAAIRHAARLDEPTVALDRLAIPRLQVGPGVLLRFLEPRPLPEQVAVFGETQVEWAYPRMAARAERLLASGVGRLRGRAEFTGAVIGRGSAAPSLPPIRPNSRSRAGLIGFEP